MTETAVPSSRGGSPPGSTPSAGGEAQDPAASTDAGTAARTGRMLVIWNPGAGGALLAGPDERRQSIEQALSAHGIQAELFESATEEQAERRIRQAIDDGVTAVVAAGGDGTVQSVAFSLLGMGVPLGILPMGTAMNVARSVGIPLELDDAARVLATGTVRALDVGMVRGQPFLEIASIGLGAEVLATATHVGEGRLRAALRVIRALLRHRRTRIRMQLDGREVRGRALVVAVANGPYTGRAIELAPEARLDDGRFDVLLYEGIGVAGFALHLLRVLLGLAHDDRIRRYRATVVRVSSRRPMPIRLDSRDLGATPVELVTRPGALRVIAPAPGQEPPAA